MQSRTAIGRKLVYLGHCTVPEVNSFLPWADKATSKGEAAQHSSNTNNNNNNKYKYLLAG